MLFLGPRLWRLRQRNGITTRRSGYPARNWPAVKKAAVTLRYHPLAAIVKIFIHNESTLIKKGSVSCLFL